MMINEYVNGYEIVRCVCFDDGCGFAYCIDKQAAHPFAIWQFDEYNDMRIYYQVQFSFNESAKHEYEDRVEQYKAGNPGVREKLSCFEKLERRLVS